MNGSRRARERAPSRPVREREDPEPTRRDRRPPPVPRWTWPWPWHAALWAWPPSPWPRSLGSLRLRLRVRVPRPAGWVVFVLACLCPRPPPRRFATPCRSGPVAAPTAAAAPTTAPPRSPGGTVLGGAGIRVVDGGSASQYRCDLCPPTARRTPARGRLCLVPGRPGCGATGPRGYVRPSPGRVGFGAGVGVRIGRRRTRGITCGLGGRGGRPGARGALGLVRAWVRVPARPRAPPHARRAARPPGRAAGASPAPASRRRAVAPVRRA